MAACPEDGWMPILRQLQPSKDMKFINIGMNKGYGIAMVLEAWQQSLGIDQRSWHRALMNALKEISGRGLQSAKEPKGVPPMCGVCRDCLQGGVMRGLQELERSNHKLSAALDLIRSTNADAKGKQGETAVLGVELNGGTADLVRHVIHALSLDSVVEVLHAGVSDHHNDLLLPSCAVGNEGCSTDMRGTGPLSRVPTWTVDDLVRNWTGDKSLIDYLEIDTEGHDPIVLKGARQMLKTGLVRILRYEYHSIGAWKSYSLQHITSSLDRDGYECYYAGQNRVWRLTGCLDATFESRKTFANVVCVLRSDIFFDVFESFEACALDSSFCGGAANGRP